MRALFVLLCLLLSPLAQAQAFSHAALSTVLARYVDANGLVDYKGIATDKALAPYLAALAADSPASNPAKFPTKDDALAYYINAYNAFAIQGVAKRPGITTVDAIKQVYFQTETWTMGGAPITLNSLENDRIRSFGDPRIHFVVNCQSAGCPRLGREAMEPARLQAQLDAAARAFVADPKKVFVDSKGAHVSQIFEWFAADFTKAGGPAAFIAAHGGPVKPGMTLTYIPYDWALVAQPGRRP